MAGEAAHDVEGGGRIRNHREQRAQAVPLEDEARLRQAEAGVGDVERVVEVGRALDRVVVEADELEVRVVGRRLPAKAEGWSARNPPRGEDLDPPRTCLDLGHSRPGRHAVAA
jgi:hypothetical protein